MIQAHEYPEGAGYQKGSETSREAALNLTDSGYQKRKVFEWMQARAGLGATIDEAAVFLSDLTRRDVPPGTASARMRELEMAQKIKKTGQRRATRTGRTAVVYLTEAAYALNVPAPRAAAIIAQNTTRRTYGAGRLTGNLGSARDVAAPPPAHQAASTGGSSVGALKDREARHGHGHVVPRTDGRKLCNGPSSCKACKQLKEYLERIGA